VLNRRLKKKTNWRKGAAVLLALAGAASKVHSAEPSDPLLDLLIQKGMLTQDEANKVRAEAEAIRSNAPPTAPTTSKWKISNAIKNVELFGDIRVRYEHRQATTPIDDRYELDRGRFAVRVGLRGDAFDNFYYGLRLETSTNPRSTWVTFGGSSPTPFGKSATGVNVGQAYLGWRPGDWLDVTIGKMPNPLYTTPMTWDGDLNPEGLAEHFKYTVGKVDFFANFGQFLYQDNNPNFISSDLLVPPGSSTPNGTTVRTGETTETTFLLAWQGGGTVHFTKDMFLKAAPVVYHYLGLNSTKVSGNAVGSSPNGIGDNFIGEGSFRGTNSGNATVNGLTVSASGVSYNQIGINNLVVLDVPAEFDFKICNLSARVFGDYAYNFEGSDRAKNAFNALGTAVASNPGLTGTPPLLTYSPQTHEVHAYQAGAALASKDALGLVYGTVSKKNAWELRGYWQHVEQYALDPNLLDSDFFEGRGNLQGFFAALAYGFSDNVIGTFRYGWAERINDKLGTGGSNLDIPQINPIQHYNLFQLDLTFRF
jgi:hypothetical protein